MHIAHVVRSAIFTIVATIGTACLADGAAPPSEPAPASPTAITPGEWTQDLDAAQALAKREQLPVFLNFSGSDWCGYCIKAEKEIFSTPAWKAYAGSNLVMVLIDFPRDAKRVPEPFRARNASLAQQFKVEGYPTFIVVDPAAGESVGQLGMSPGITAASLIRDVRRAARKTAGAAARAEARMDEASRADYQALLKRLEAVNREASDWIATRPEQNAENNARYEAYVGKLEDLEQAADRLEGLE